MELGQIYKIDGDPKTPDHYSNKIFEETGLLTTQCYLINNKKDLFLKFQKGVGEHQLNNAKNIRTLNLIGLELKLSPDQTEKNTIFVTSAPIAILETDPTQLLEEINRDNPNIVAISIYAPPAKSFSQNLTSLKITLASRVMANSCFKFGIKIKGCYIDPQNINQGLYTKVPQCKRCNHFHEIRNCLKTFNICPICGGEHEKFSCNRKDARPFCINCRGHHRATSNQCPVRREFLTDAHIPDTKEEHLISPFNTKHNETFIPAPAPSTSFWDLPPDGRNSLHPTGTPNITPPTANVGVPITTYSDCLKMSLEFKQWYPTFLILQTLTGLSKLELPETLRRTINTQNNIPDREDTTANPVLPSSNNNSSQAEPTQQSPPFFIPAPNKKRPYLPWPPRSLDNLDFPLTGANTVPLLQRTNTDRPHKEPLLPTPPDPFQFPHRNTGAIGKKHYKEPPTETFYYVSRSQKEKESNPPLGPRPNTSVNNTNQKPSTTQSSNKNINNSILTPEVRVNTSQKPDPKSALNPAPINSINTNTSTSKQTNPITTTPNEDIINDIQIIPGNQTSAPTSSNIQDESNPTTISYSTLSPKEKQSPTPIQINPNLEKSIQANPKTPNYSKKPPITKPKPDLSQYKPQDIPRFLKSKLPPNRHTMDPEQFKSTIKSFEALSNAAIKQAEQEYIETKKDFLLNTSLPEFKNIKTQNSFSILQEIPQDPQSPDTSSSTSTYTLGTSQSNNATIHTRKQYKHPTPPPQHSDSENEDDPAPLDTADNDNLPDLTHSPVNKSRRRLLRSNSKQYTSPSQ